MFEWELITSKVLWDTQSMCRHSKLVSGLPVPWYEDQRLISTWCLNRVVQRKPEDVVLHVKARANWLQDKCLDVCMGLILISLPNHQQSLTEFSYFIFFAQVGIYRDCRWTLVIAQSLSSYGSTKNVRQYSTHLCNMSSQ